MQAVRDPDYATLLPEAAAVEPPCLSLYQPTHRHYPDTQQNPIRFKNLVSVLETSALSWSRSTGWPRTRRFGSTSVTD